MIGRFSNLYGPGQNLGKLQGLISRLALSAVTRQPINIFVPLDTIRDYVYVDDAAQPQPQPSRRQRRPSRRRHTGPSRRPSSSPPASR